MLKFEIFTLFPNIFDSYIQESIISRAVEKNLITISVHNIRDWATDKHHVTDEPPYGGGGGMIMKPEPIFSSVEEILPERSEQVPLIFFTPQGEPFTQSVADELSKLNKIGLLCGRYEGVDERVRQHLVTREISIGDFVLTGGELPAMTVIDAVTRLLPDALGDPNGAANDSFATGLLEHPHYTRPETFRDWQVPAVLLSGNHAAIETWRREQSLLRTLQRRPDLLGKMELSDLDRQFLEKIENQDNDQKK